MSENLFGLTVAAVSIKGKALILMLALLYWYHILI